MRRPLQIKPGDFLRAEHNIEKRAEEFLVKDSSYSTNPVGLITPENPPGAKLGLEHTPHRWSFNRLDPRSGSTIIDSDEIIVPGDYVRFEHESGTFAFEFNVNKVDKKGTIFGESVSAPRHLAHWAFSVLLPISREVPTIPGYYSDVVGDACHLDTAGNWWCGREMLDLEEVSDHVPFTRLHPKEEIRKEESDNIRDRLLIGSSCPNKARVWIKETLDRHEWYANHP